MKKHLFNSFVLTCVCALLSTSSALAYVNQVSISPKQQQSDLYTQQVEYLRQQTEYLQQQTEALRQQNEALRQNQAYNQGYVEGQNYYHREVYNPGFFFGGLCTGYVLGHWSGYRHCYPHCCHRYW